MDRGDTRSRLLLDPDRCQLLLNIARSTILAKLGGLPTSSPPDLSGDESLNRPAGTFVSLHDRTTHALRGCVGRLDASEPLLKSLIDSASSVLEDPRFKQQPVTAAELSNLEIEISVLSPLEPAENVLAFDLLNDGIYLRIDGRGGCFLPQVARETGWTKEQLLDRLCTEKLGLPADAWRGKDVTLQRFSTVIIGPEPFIPS